LRQRFGFHYRLLLSNGGPCPPWDCARFDAVQQVSPAHDASGREFGLSAERSFLVPYGTDGARLRPPPDWNRAAARRHFDLPEAAFVVLSLAALNRHHKRVDWLIQEFSKLKAASTFLVLAGNREAETNELEALAAQLLPAGNFRFVQLPYTEVPDLLRASDVMVQCSLDEGFGRVYTEAMGAAVPLLAHPHLTARWIIDNPDCMVDMTVRNLLVDKLHELSQNPSVGQKIAERNLVSFRRFDWNVLVPEYLRMYENVSLLSQGTAHETVSSSCHVSQ
jgi:glycosyltransferase involved in cell wall biosynthesis